MTLREETNDVTNGEVELSGETAILVTITSRWKYVLHGRVTLIQGDRRRKVTSINDLRMSPIWVGYPVV